MFMVCSILLRHGKEIRVRRPDDIERLYLDFDGFFASVEQLANPALRGKPVGVIPFAGARNSCVIACSREAKRLGVKNVMAIGEAQSLCPDIILVPQSPDLYRRAHNALLSEITAIIPIDAVKSIDELTCKLGPHERSEADGLGRRIKDRLAVNIGPWITCSIGYAANRQLAKMACKAGKPDGNMVWHPSEMPGPLLTLKLSDVPGIGDRMERRLISAGITTMPALLATQPKQLRQLWGNVTGERLWYALHGYEIQAGPSGRSMYGHGRVLPPEHRTIAHAQASSRLLLTKAARRMRRDRWHAGRLWLWLQVGDGNWQGRAWLPAVSDDQAVLSALEIVWCSAREALSPNERILRLGVTLLDLTRASERQLDLLLDDDPARIRHERLSAMIDAINSKYGRTVVSVGPWSPPPGGYAGGKISYTRIPRAEDFW